VTAPIKLALASRRYPPLIGGAERVFSYLALALAEAGSDVSVLTSRIAEAEGLPEREEVAAPDGRLVVHRRGTARARFVGTWLYMRNLRRWLKSHPVDLAYVSMLKHDAYVAVKVGRDRGSPVVLRPEGAGATGDVAWQARGAFGRRIAARCRRADAFVAISTAVHDELTTAGYDPSKIHDLPNGVPIPSLAWGPRPDWDRSPRAMFVGRLAVEKNLGALIDAWPIVLKSRPDARLTLVGEGPERSALERRARGLGLVRAGDLPGASAHVDDLLRTADLFILPSIEEGMSIALLEAMALGVPVVASAIAGNRRLVVDGVHGLLAEPEPHALARAIVDQWAEFDRALHMSRAARGRVEREFSITAVARRHLDLFRSLIEANRIGTS
jgi:glycosyltransferase involved in cell wall biosynthesis